jgi:hypothetical protein
MKARFIDKDELNAILAGLRYLQLALDTDEGLVTAKLPEEIVDILTDDPGAIPLSPTMIDNLCYELNSCNMQLLGEW